MLKKFGNFLMKKITKLSIKKGIKYGIYSIFWFYGFALLGILGIEGIAIAGVLTYTGVLDYGIDKLI